MRRRKNPLSSDAVTLLGWIGGLGAVAAVGTLAYKAGQTAAVAPATSAAASEAPTTPTPTPAPTTPVSLPPVQLIGDQVFVLQSSAVLNLAAIQTVFGANTRADSFTSIPLASEDPNAAMLWLVTTNLAAPVTQAALAAALPVGVTFSAVVPPTIQLTPNSFTVDPSQSYTVTTQASGSSVIASGNDVANYLQTLLGFGIGSVSGVTPSSAVANSGGQYSPFNAIPAQITGQWDASIMTPDNVPAGQTLSDATVIYNGQTMSFVTQMVTLSTLIAQNNLNQYGNPNQYPPGQYGNPNYGNQSGNQGPFGNQGNQGPFGNQGGGQGGAQNPLGPQGPNPPLVNQGGQYGGGNPYPGNPSGQPQPGQSGGGNQPVHTIPGPSGSNPSQSPSGSLPPQQGGSPSQQAGGGNLPPQQQGPQQAGGQQPGSQPSGSGQGSGPHVAPGGQQQQQGQGQQQFTPTHQQQGHA